MDILVETRIRLEEVKRGFSFMKSRYALNPELRLRYRFDFRPCHMECHFAGVIRKESESIQSVFAGAFPTDKYLIPVMSSEDYAWLADAIHKDCYIEEIRKDLPIDPAFFRKTGLLENISSASGLPCWWMIKPAM